MPWYLHVYHAAWLALVLAIGYLVSWSLCLFVVSTIVILAIWKA